MQNQKLRAVLIDDEDKANAALHSLLQLYCPDVEVIKICNDIQEAIPFISRHTIDIIFLDVQLESNKTGFDLLDQIDHFHINIVLVTSYIEYAYKAYRYGAFSYLLKPVNPQELVQTVHRIVGRKKSLYPLQKEPHTPSLITIINKEEIHLVKDDEIEYAEAQGSYASIYKVDGKVIRLSRNLKYFESLTEHNPSFLRVHRSFVINIRHIHTLQSSREGKIVMKSGSSVPTSMNNKDLLKILNDSFVQ